ncbi:hypothetical protein HD601_005607 [Jiangella mangrovi]|uniref:Uncharacterized protein n=1 Tax=Jiangella mangrovi TaxID=1524084 RepID=A0A7W9GW31_9ACTN|nr:hypothetical protein [Jiangella mangrovi]
MTEADRLVRHRAQAVQTLPSGEVFLAQRIGHDTARTRYAVQRPASARMSLAPTPIRCAAPIRADTGAATPSRVSHRTKAVSCEAPGQGHHLYSATLLDPASLATRSNVTCRGEHVHADLRGLLASPGLRCE